MKIVNFKCTGCGKEKEELLTEQEIREGAKESQVCEFCKSTMKLWNFKNNSQVWKFEIGR